MIDRDIILDLLPLYRAGLGSAKTRALVEAWLAEHPGLDDCAASAAPERAEWREPFDRARSISRRRRRLHALAIALTALCFALEIHFGPGGGIQIRPVALDAPLLFAPLGVAALVAWLFYWRAVRGR